MRTISRSSIVSSVVLGLVAVLAAVSCGRDVSAIGAQGPSRPRVLHALADYLHSFAALDGLVATSGVVVEGKVVAIEKRENPTEGGPATTARIVVLVVDEVLYRRDGAPKVRPGDRIEIDGEGWWEGSSRVIVNGMSWSEVDDRGFYFLTFDPCRERLTLINDQGRYLSSGNDLYGTESNDRLINRVLAMSTSQFRESVADAAHRARSGEIEPEPAPAPKCSEA